MKKKKKRTKKNHPINKKKPKKAFKRVKKSNIKKVKVRQKKISKKRKVKKSKKVIKKYKFIESKQSNFLLKVINFQNSIKPELKFKFNFGFEKYIQAFFDKIAETILQYKILKKDESRRLKLENQEKERLEKIEAAKEKQKEAELKVKLKEQALKDEIRLEKQRTKEIKLFLRKEQALLRIEQAEKQKQFLQ